MKSLVAIVLWSLLATSAVAQDVQLPTPKPEAAPTAKELADLRAEIAKLKATPPARTVEAVTQIFKSSFDSAVVKQSASVEATACIKAGGQLVQLINVGLTQAVLMCQKVIKR